MGADVNWIIQCSVCNVRDDERGVTFEEAIERAEKNGWVSLGYASRLCPNCVKRVVSKVCEINHMQQ